MSIHAVSWALKQSVKPASAKLALIAIANYADAHGRCWPSQQTLAADTNLTERSIRTAIATLEQLGLLKRVARRRKDGSRASDIIQIPALMDGQDQPEYFSGCERDTSEPTGKNFRNNRKNMTDQPEGFSGLTTFEPSLNHQENHSSAATPPRRAGVGDWFDQFWATYPSRGHAANPKKPARDKFARAVKSGADPKAIISAAERFADIERRAGRFGTEKVAQAQTWLNQQRWEDYSATMPPGPARDSRASVFNRG